MKNCIVNRNQLNSAELMLIATNGAFKAKVNELKVEYNKQRSALLNNAMKAGIPVATSIGEITETLDVFIKIED